MTNEESVFFCHQTSEVWVAGGKRVCSTAIRPIQNKKYSEFLSRNTFIEAAWFISLHAHQHSPHDAAEEVGVTDGVISLTRDQGQIGVPFEMLERKTAGVWPD